MGAPYNPPIKGEDFVVFVALSDLNVPGAFKAAPTIALGDFKVDKDGAGLVNLTALPTVTPAGSVLLRITLTATEMNADVVTIVGIDQTAPKEWSDFVLSIPTTGPGDIELLALAGLTSAADQVPFFTGSGTASSATASLYSRGLWANTSQALWQTALGMGTAAFQPTGTTGHTIPFLDGVNIWSAAQTMTLATPSAIPLTLISTDAGALTGPYLDLYRNSISPAASDNLGLIRFRGQNSTPAAFTYGEIYSQIVDHTAGVETSRIYLRNYVKGIVNNTLIIDSGGGVQIDEALYSPTSTGSVNTTARLAYNLASWRGVAASIGAVVFHAPTTAMANMHRFRVVGYVHTTGATSVDFNVMGYHAATGGAWSPIDVQHYGTNRPMVRWGQDPAGCNCLIIGDVTTSNVWVHLAITEALISHTVADTYMQNWTVSLETDLSLYTTVTADLTLTDKGAPRLDGAGGVTLTGGLTASGNIITDGGYMMVNRVGDAVDAIQYLQVDAGQYAHTIYRTGAVARWQLGKNNDAESTGDAGSNFYLWAYSDAGASLGRVFRVLRSSRVLTFDQIPTAPTPAPGDNSPNLATTGFVTAAITATSGSFQPLDPTLTSLAGITGNVANTIPYFSATDVFSITPFTLFGRSLVDDLDAPAARATLLLGTAATQNTGTSAHTIPFLDTINTWALTQNFIPGQDIEAVRAGRSTGQSILLYSTGNNNLIVSNSTPAAAKPLIINATTDMANSTVSGGSLSIAFQILGTSYFSMSSTGLATTGTSGGFMGVGTINAGALYEGGVALSTKYQATGSYQPLDPTLSAFAALTGTSDTIPYFTSFDVFQLTPFTLFGRQLIDDIDSATARATLGLVIGTDVQPYSVALTNWATKAIPTGVVVGTTDVQTLTAKTIDASLNTVSNLTTTMFASGVIDTDPALSANSNTRLPTQAAVKSYADNLLTGLSWKAAVTVATTANITLAGEQTIDGVLTSGSRVLVKNQTTASQNGIYISAAGSWVRSLDTDTATELLQATVFVQRGTLNADTQWTCSNDTITLGTTSIVFSQVAGAGTYSAGIGLSLIGNQFAISDVELLALLGTTAAADQLPYYTSATAAATTTLSLFSRGLLVNNSAATWQTALGLGTAALAATGTSAHTVPFLDGANTWSASQIMTLATASAVPLTLISTEAAGAAGPYLDLYRNSISPAANDQIGIIRFRGQNSAAASITYGDTVTQIVDFNAGTETAKIFFRNYVKGVQNNTLVLDGGGGIIIDESLFSPTSTGSPNTLGRVAYNVALFRHTGAVTGAIVFHAPTTTMANMHRMRVVGYNYAATNTVIDFNVSGYHAVTAGAWTNMECQHFGTMRPMVRWGQDAAGCNCLIIGDITTGWSYPNYAIVEMLISHNGSNDAYMQGWTVSFETDLSLFVSLTADLTLTDKGAQPLDPTLTAFAAITGTFNAANKVPYFTGTDTFTTTTLSPFAITLIDDIDAPAMRATLLLGTAAVQNIGTIGATVPLMSTSNIWSLMQEHRVDLLNGAATALWLHNNTLGAAGTEIIIDMTPSTNSINIRSAQIAAYAFSNSQAGLKLRTANANLPVDVLTLTHDGGVFVGAATGGNKGVNTFNANIIYEAGTSLVAKYLPLAGGTMTGTIKFTDANFYIGMNGIVPTLQFDVGDAITYDRTTNILAMGAAGANRLSVSGTAVTSTLPVTLPADPTTALQAATKQYVDAHSTGFLFASTEGIIEDDGVTDMCPALLAACNKAITQKKPLILDLARIRVKTAFRLDTLPAGSTLRIYSLIKTKIVIAAGTNQSTWGVISGVEIVGTTPVTFNSGSGDAPLTMYPLTKLSQDDGPGWTCRVVSTVGLQAGQLIRIMSKRLPVCEHRFSTYVGELNRIRTVNPAGYPSGTLELDEKLRHHYRIGTLHSTTVAARTANSITFTTAPPASLLDHMIGLTVTTTGTGATERNIQWYDAATKTLSFPTGGSWDQLPYNPLPAVLSTVTLSAEPWVFVLSPINVTLQGFTIDATEDYGLTLRGLSIHQVDRLSVVDVGAINFQIWGLHIVDCYEPVVRYTYTDRSNDTSLGYSSIWSGNRNGTLDGAYANNNRRLADGGGQCQGVGMLCSNFQVTGGWKSSAGVWEDEVIEDYNYGIGDHGGALDWVWQNGIIRNTKVGCIFRGGGEVARNIKFEGYPENVFIYGAGYGRTIENIIVDDGLGDQDFTDSAGGLHYQTYSTPAFLQVDCFQFARSGYSYKGPSLIRDISVNGALYQLIYFDNGGELGLTLSDWVVKDIVFRSQRNAPSNAYLFKSGDSDDLSTTPDVMLLKNFTVQNIQGYYRGTTGHLFETRAVEQAYNSWMRIEDRVFRIRVSDDQKLYIPVSLIKSGIDPNNLVRVVVYPSSPTISNWFGDMLISPSSSSITLELGVITNVKVMSPTVIGVSDPDGTLNIGVSSDGLTLRNRMGGEIYGTVEVRV